MLNGNWELIKDEMWRNVAAQIGYKEERWEAVETDGYKRLNHYLEDAKNNSLVMIWQLSRNVVNDIYNLMKDCKDYGFKDQIQRAAISIMNNIAEGFDSGSDKKFISYLNTTKKTIRHSHFQSRTI